MTAQEFGILQENILLSKHTSWRVGGPARYFYQPRNIEDLATFLRQKNGQDVFWLGLGSNLLVRDNGYPGVSNFYHTWFASYRAVR